MRRDGWTPLGGVSWYEPENPRRPGVECPYIGAPP